MQFPRPQNPQPLPPDAAVEDLMQKAGDASARAYALTDRKAPVASAKSYLAFRDTVKSMYTPIVRRIYGGQ